MIMKYYMMQFVILNLDTMFPLFSQDQCLQLIKHIIDFSMQQQSMENK